MFTNGDTSKTSREESAFALGLSEIHQKGKGAVKMRTTVLKMRITCKQKCDRNDYVNCGWRNVHRSIYKLEISLALKWLIVLRLAVKMCDQTHQVLKSVLFATSLETCTEKMHVYMSSMQAEGFYGQPHFHKGSQAFLS